MKVKDISVIGRNTQGVRLITLDGADEKVAGLSYVPEVKDDELGEGAAGEGAAPADEAPPTAESAPTPPPGEDEPKA
jgi:DNA gyrase subunit A